MSTIDAFRRSLDPDSLILVDVLRRAIAEARPGLSERIKWNAPSFAIGDDDRITLGLERKGGVRVVLHRGAKVKDASGFRFEDPDGLAQWPTPDRGVIVFRDASALEAVLPAFRTLCARWVAATA